MARVSFHRLAERELNDAALYSEHESPGLGVSFLDEIERHIEAIVKNPNAGKRCVAKFGVAYSANSRMEFFTQ
jgi:plasmid stabilization system protein ParE